MKTRKPKIAKVPEQVAFRASPNLIERVDRVADAMAEEDGIGSGRSTAIRKLILTGLPALESLYGINGKGVA